MNPLPPCPNCIESVRHQLRHRWAICTSCGSLLMLDRKQVPSFAMDPEMCDYEEGAEPLDEQRRRLV
jgi:hypothetical protein